MPVTRSGAYPLLLSSIAPLLLSAQSNAALLHYPVPPGHAQSLLRSALAAHTNQTLSGAVLARVQAGSVTSVHTEILETRYDNDISAFARPAGSEKGWRAQWFLITTAPSLHRLHILLLPAWQRRAVESVL